MSRLRNIKNTPRGVFLYRDWQYAAAVNKQRVLELYASFLKRGIEMLIERRVELESVSKLSSSVRDGSCSMRVNIAIAALSSISILAF